MASAPRVAGRTIPTRYPATTGAGVPPACASTSGRSGSDGQDGSARVRRNLAGTGEGADQALSGLCQLRCDAGSDRRPHRSALPRRTQRPLEPADAVSTLQRDQVRSDRAARASEAAVLEERAQMSPSFWRSETRRLRAVAISLPDACAFFGGRRMTRHLGFRERNSPQAKQLAGKQRG